MANYRPKSNEPRDYKERFEFRLTVGDNIICQRYFKINNFNPVSVASMDLTDTIEELARVIDRDLKQKSAIFLELTTPRFFASEDEMTKYFENPSHREEMHLGEGLVVRNPKSPNYFWGKNGPQPLTEKFMEDVDSTLSDDDHVEYKLAFLVDDREVCARIWDGVYPKYVSNSVDLSNAKVHIDEKVGPSHLPFAEYMTYKFTQGRGNLIYTIISTLQQVCSQESKWYQTVVDWGGIKYDFNPRKETAKQTVKSEK